MCGSIRYTAISRNDELAVTYFGNDTTREFQLDSTYLPCTLSRECGSDLKIHKYGFSHVSDANKYPNTGTDPKVRNRSMQNVS